jgi:hypothetical protein
MITSAARLMDFSFLFLLKNREKPAGYLLPAVYTIPFLHHAAGRI